MLGLGAYDKEGVGKHSSTRRQVLTLTQHRVRHVLPQASTANAAETASARHAPRRARAAAQRALVAVAPVVRMQCLMPAAKRVTSRVSVDTNVTAGAGDKCSCGKVCKCSSCPGQKAPA